MPPRETLADLWVWFRPRTKRLARPTEVASQMERRLLPAFGSMSWPALSADAVDLWLSSLDGEIAPATINNLRALGGRIINAALRARRWGGANPFYAAEKRKVPRKRRPVLNQEDARAVIASASERLAPRWAVLLGLGPRYGELRALEPADWDARAQMLHIHKSGTRDSTKTGRSRSVPVPEWLAVYLDQAAHLTRSRWLFPNRWGGQLGRTSGLRQLACALRAAGIVSGFKYWCGRRACRYSDRRHLLTPSPPCPRCGRALHVSGIPRHMRVHDLRHSFVTMAQEAGVNPGVVALTVGHHAQRSGQVTFGVYSHYSDAYVRTELSRLNLTPQEPQPMKRSSKKDMGAVRAERHTSQTQEMPSAVPVLGKMLSTAEVADRLGLDATGVRRLIHTKRLPAYSWHRDFRVTETDLAAFITKSRTVQP